jgi:hypothetical protein
VVASLTTYLLSGLFRGTLVLDSKKRINIQVDTSHLLALTRTAVCVHWSPSSGKEVL